METMKKLMHGLLKARVKPYYLGMLSGHVMLELDQKVTEIAAAGAAAAPSLFAWGLQQTSATTASLLLNGEAVFTVVLSPVSGRVHHPLVPFWRNS